MHKLTWCYPLLFCVGLTACVQNTVSTGAGGTSSYVYDEEYGSPTLGVETVDFGDGYVFNDSAKTTVNRFAQRPVPVAHSDKDWVMTQSPDHYTIQMAKSDKPQSVAKTLFAAPKRARMAQVQTHQWGGQVYQGLYGSYTSQADAEEALQQLPDAVRQHAKVVPWSSVQNTL